MITSGERLTEILIIDDDSHFCQLLRDYLEPLGYRVTTTHTASAGLEVAGSGEFGAIILDVMLPDIHGLDALRHLRMRSNVPIVMLTGRAEESDRIVGLEMGADDYLPKTVSMRELLARLRAVMRRSPRTHLPKGNGDASVIRNSELTVYPYSRSACLSGKRLQLTTVEFDLLLSLARAAGRVKTRDELLLEVAERGFNALDRSIDVHISSLRKKLGDHPKLPRFIVTVRGAGYMMQDCDASCDLEAPESIHLASRAEL